MIYTIFGIMLMLFGLAVSIIFWWPGIVDRNRIKEVLGRRYPLIFIIYIANGPLLVMCGILLVIWPRI